MTTPERRRTTAERAVICLGFHVTVDSNGYLFHDLLHRVTPAELDYLSFSLDGPDAAVNDAIRGAGSFAVCTENIRRAVEMGFNVSLICTVSALNIPEGCVMNRLLQPDNIGHHPDGRPLHRISCCLLKQEIAPEGGCLLA